MPKFSMGDLFEKLKGKIMNNRIENLRDFKKATKDFKSLREMLNTNFTGWYSYNEKKSLVQYFCSFNGALAWAMWKFLGLKTLEDFLILWAICEKQKAHEIYEIKLNLFENPSYYDPYDDECPEGYDSFMVFEEMVEDLAYYYNSFKAIEYYDMAYELGYRAEKALKKYKKISQYMRTILGAVKHTLTEEQIEKMQLHPEKIFGDSLLSRIKGGAYAKWFKAVSKSNDFGSCLVELFSHWHTGSIKLSDKTSYETLARFYNGVILPNLNH